MTSSAGTPGRPSVAAACSVSCASRSPACNKEQAAQSEQRRCWACCFAFQLCGATQWLADAASLQHFTPAWRQDRGRQHISHLARKSLLWRGLLRTCQATEAVKANSSAVAARSLPASSAAMYRPSCRPRGQHWLVSGAGPVQNKYIGQGRCKLACMYGVWHTTTHRSAVPTCPHKMKNIGTHHVGRLPLLHVSLKLQDGGCGILCKRSPVLQASDLCVGRHCAVRAKQREAVCQPGPSMYLSCRSEAGTHTAAPGTPEPAGAVPASTATLGRAQWHYL